VVEHLPSKGKALSSKPSTEKETKKIYESSLSTSLSAYRSCRRQRDDERHKKTY
jgi:hypothetical protein